MRRRLAAIAAGTALSASTLAVAPTVTAEVPASRAVEHTLRVSKRGARCVVAGVRTLLQLRLLEAAARQQVDYSTFADPVSGPIFTTLPPGSFLPLGEVIRLHYTDPSLFAWCR